MALLLGACAGDDSAADGMAEEVGGECVFTPGSYVASYEVLSASSSCADFEPLADEYVTVTESGSMVSRNQVPAGCTDGPPVVDGCFVGFNRSCVHATSGGVLEVDIVFQFDYEEGSGIIDLSSSVYSGAVLLDTCDVTQEATIRRR